MPSKAKKKNCTCVAVLRLYKASTTPGASSRYSILRRLASVPLPIDKRLASGIAASLVSPERYVTEASLPFLWSKANMSPIACSSIVFAGFRPPKGDDGSRFAWLLSKCRKPQNRSSVLTYFPFRQNIRQSTDSAFAVQTCQHFFQIGLVRCNH